MDNQILNSKYQIANSLKKIIKDLIGEEIEPQVDLQADLSKGDFSTNVAMVAFGRIKNEESHLRQGFGGQAKNPMELAEEIVRLLNTKYKTDNAFRLVEAKEPGFINFWLSNEQIDIQINSLIDGSKTQRDQAGQTIIFEFGDLNPFKEPHIGHLRNLALGESLVRLLESQGNKVMRLNYQGDVGMHVAKCLWGILQNQKSSIRQAQDKKIKNQKLDEGTLEERVRFLAEAYSEGAKAYEGDENAKKEIISINNKIYQKHPEVLEIWEKGRKISLDYFEKLYKKLGVKYDKYYSESETALEGLKIVKDNPNIFEKHDGALIFRGENVGLHTRVFVTKENYATYEGKDLALAVLKEKDFPNTNKSIIMTANEQTEYFKVMFAALKLVNPKIADKTSHLSYGAVNLKEGKMSSRRGNVVLAFWLIDETKKRLKNDFKEVSDDVLDQLAVGSVKWAMLKFSRESNISFSIEESIDLVGNSGPYMQYTYARIQSLLEKGKNDDFEANSVKSLEQDLLALMRVVCQFETVVKMAGDNFSPNILCNYLYNLAQNFNKFYEKEKIIGSDGEEEKLAVIKAVGEVIKKGLYLLGIASPARI